MTKLGANDLTWRLSKKDGLKAVSYTHLDVYKRQGLLIALWRKIGAD